MAQLEYGDYYKFIASAGIALLAAAVLLPWIFLREPFDLTVEVSKIALLTPDAQNIIRERQHLIGLIITFVPWISIALGGTGLLTTFIGLRLWHERQSIRDKGEDIDVEKRNRELQAMSETEVNAKAQEDLQSAEDHSEPPLVPSTTTSSLRDYLAVESAVLQRIRQCVDSSVKVMSNQRLRNVEYDAIITPGKGEATIVEIKYIRKGFNRGFLTEAVNNLASKTALYSETFSRRAQGILLIVFAPSAQGLKTKVSELTAQLYASQPSRAVDVRIRTLDQDSIESLPCNELKSLLS